jgi:hypothetical protein
MLNCSIYNKMKAHEKLNPAQENQEYQNPNPPPPPQNEKNEINEGLVIFRNLEEQLRETREPSRVSLATSLDIIMHSIASSQGTFLKV